MTTATATRTPAGAALSDGWELAAFLEALRDLTEQQAALVDAPDGIAWDAVAGERQALLAAARPLMAAFHAALQDPGSVTPEDAGAWVRCRTEIQRESDALMALDTAIRSRLDARRDALWDALNDVQARRRRFRGFRDVRVGA